MGKEKGEAGREQVGFIGGLLGGKAQGQGAMMCSLGGGEKTGH